MEMTYEAISTLLRQEILTMKPNFPTTYTDADHFMDDLGMDSLDLTEFVARIELTYRLEVEDADWKSLTSVRAAAQYVLNRAHGTIRS